MNPNLDFEFFLASQLHMPVGELRDRMSNGEFLDWSVWYARKNQQQQLEAAKGR